MDEGLSKEFVPGGSTGEPVLLVCEENTGNRAEMVPVYSPGDAGPNGVDHYTGHRGRIVLPHFTNFHCFSAARFADVITEARVRWS